MYEILPLLSGERGLILFRSFIFGQIICNKFTKHATTFVKIIWIFIFCKIENNFVREILSKNVAIFTSCICENSQEMVSPCYNLTILFNPNIWGPYTTEVSQPKVHRNTSWGWIFSWNLNIKYVKANWSILTSSNYSLIHIWKEDIIYL